MKGFQTIKWNLPTLNWAAGANLTTLLRDLPLRLFGRFVHLAAITFEVDIDPTFTAVPTEIGIRNVVTRLRITDGRNDRFIGRGFPALRMREILEEGKLRHADPDNTTSTNNAYFRQTWDTGPANFEGSPSDHLIPVALLQAGQIDYTCGALTDISADTTAMTAIIRPVAHLVLLDHIQIPPVYEWRETDANAANIALPGRALYAFLAAFNDSAYGAIAAGDFGAFNVNTGTGPVVSGVDAELLSACYHAEMRSGHLTPVYGESRAATDDNQKVVNGATPTALVSAAARIQPILQSMHDARISKLVALAENNLQVDWNGTQASGTFAAGRFLSQPDSVVGQAAAQAAQALGLSPSQLRALEVKTLSKRPYGGPRAEFMPYALKLKKAA